jgi:hypothetical protein
MIDVDHYRKPNKKITTCSAAPVTSDGSRAPVEAHRGRVRRRRGRRPPRQRHAAPPSRELSISTTNWLGGRAQRFGGGRVSGIDDRPGKVWNLIGFAASARSGPTICRLPTDYRSSHLQPSAVWEIPTIRRATLAAVCHGGGGADRLPPSHVRVPARHLRGDRPGGGPAPLPSFSRVSADQEATGEALVADGFSDGDTETATRGCPSRG